MTTTTTPQQQPAGDPAPGGRTGGGLTGRVVAAVVVVLVAAGALAWLFLAGPASSSARAERDVEQTLRGMVGAESFADFNSYMCAENRVPQDLVDTIMASSEQTGTDLDTMFRESIAGSFPEDLEVTAVEITEGGAAALATVESDSEAGTEEVSLRDEDGSWKLCQAGVGMGAVPETEQPG